MFIPIMDRVLRHICIELSMQTIPLNGDSYQELHPTTHFLHSYGLINGTEIFKQNIS